MTAAIVLLVEFLIGCAIGLLLVTTIMVGAASDTLADARKTLWVAVALAAVMVGFGHLLALVKP